MFVGHFGVGFGTKKADQKPSLGTLFLAAQFLDLIWPIFLLLGIEEVRIEPGFLPMNALEFIYYPFSHSLFFVLIWSVLFGVIYYSFKKDLRTSLILGVLVTSHWILDLIVHIPDLPILPWINFKVGFGLWNSVVASIILEGLIFILGVYFYVTSTKPKNKTGSISLWVLVIFLAFVYILSLFGSTPPSVNAIAIAGLSQWLFVASAYWIDKNREPVKPVVI